MLLQQCPQGLEYLWDIFNSMGRPATQRGGYEYITQAEMMAWQQNNATRLTPWELETLRTLDMVAGQVAARFNRQAQS